MNPRTRRSELVAPASSANMLAKSPGLGADVVIIDLEDAISPDRKDEARAATTRALTELSWTGTTRAVRINHPGSGLALEDLTRLVTEAPDTCEMVVIPKVTAPRDVWWVETTLDELEYRHGARRRIGLEILVEDTAAVAELAAIAACSRRTEALVFGPGDFSASQGLDLQAAGNDHPDLYPGDVWHHVRSAIAIAAGAAGVCAIDGAYAAIDNPDGYRRECLRARTVGFTGKWAIHPSQVSVANEVFTPDPARIAWARETVAAYERAATTGSGATSHRGSLIDAATLRTARRLMAQAPPQND